MILEIIHISTMKQTVNEKTKQEINILSSSNESSNKWVVK